MIVAATTSSEAAAINPSASFRFKPAMSEQTQTSRTALGGGARKLLNENEEAGRVAA